MPTKQFVTGSGEIVTVDAKDAADWAGYPEATNQQIHLDNLKQQYSSWLYAPEAAALGVGQTLFPGATSAIVGGLSALSPDVGQTTGDFIQGVQAAHPVASNVGKLSGIVTGGIAAGAEKLGAGALAATAGVQTAAMTADDLALKHLRDPEGAEKVAMTLGLSFVLGTAGGALVNKGLAALSGSTVGKAGAALAAKGQEALNGLSIVHNPGVVADLEAAGTKNVVDDLATKYQLLTKSPSQLKATLKKVISSSETDLNQIKATAPEKAGLAGQVSFSNSLKPLLQGIKVEGVGEGPTVAAETVTELHTLRTKIDQLINHADPSSPASQKLLSARDLVSQHIQDILGLNESVNPALNTGIASRWEAAEADYHAASSLQAALSNAEQTGKSFLSKLGHSIHSAGKTSAIFGTLGGNLGVAGAGVATSAAGKGLELAADGTLKGYVLTGAGKFMQGVDETVVQTVVNGLTKKNIAGSAFAPLTLSNYDDLKATITWATENPTAAVPQLANDMEKAGVPGPMIDAAVPQNIMALQYLKTKLPQNPMIGMTVAPVDFTPSLAQKAMVIQAANAINNPLGELQNPTQAGMEALRTVYPILAQRASLMAAQEAGTQARMALANRQWAAKITGRPGTPLDNPMARAIMAGAGQSAQAQSQASGASAQRPSNAQIKNNPLTQTRLNRLSE